MRRRIRSISLFSVVLFLTLAVHAVPAAFADRKPPKLSDNVLRIYERLEGVEELDDRKGNIPDPPGEVDPLSPAAVFQDLLDHLENLRSGARRGTRERKLLGQVVRSVGSAWRVFNDGSHTTRPMHLRKTMQRLQVAQRAMNRVRRRSGPPLEEHQMRLSMMAARIAEDLLDLARRAGAPGDKLAESEDLLLQGLQATADGRYVQAAGLFGGSLDIATNTVTFDVEVFEQNINDTMNGEVVGYAYSIAFKGQIQHGGGSWGEARTAADPPTRSQSPDKELHVASVSKTLSAILTMRVLQDLGLSPGEKIWPYLPGDWMRGTGVDQLTFRDLMTHRSGFGQQPVGGNSYDNLRILIAQDVGSTGFNYCNCNFGMLRVLVPGLLGLDPSDPIYVEFATDRLVSAVFIDALESLYSTIGADFTCWPTENHPTVQYNFPDSGNPGYPDGDRSLACGGIGFWVTANELARIMTAWRNSELLMSTATRKTMQDGFLGLMKPPPPGGSGGYGFARGVFGIYYAHAGDWSHSTGDAHTCVMAFPIVVEASLLINSERGDIPSQCNVLKQAFENAWVAH